MCCSPWGHKESDTTGRLSNHVLHMVTSLLTLVVKNLPADTGDAALISGLGRFPEGGNGNPLWYSCLENSMDRGARQAIVHGVANSRT